MSLLSLRSISPWIFGRPAEPRQSVEALLARIRQRLYPETLPVLSSCWLRTLCLGGHNRAWWAELHDAVMRAAASEGLDPFAHDVVLSIQGWIEQNVLSGAAAPVGRRPEAPFRTIPAERMVPYVARLLNEWLLTEIAYMLANDAEPGIPCLSAARALDGLLVRERLSPETLELMVAGGEIFSPKLIYPADAEILRDLALARLGRVSAPASQILPATLLGAAADAALPADFEQAVGGASVVQGEAGEELHVPIAASDAAQMLTAESLRIASVVVTMDGRAWQASRLHAGDQAMVVFTPGERLRIDVSADHAKLTVHWPEAPSQWFGAVPPRGPFAVFGREWRTASWEMNRQATLLHLTFSQVLPIAETPEPAAAAPRLVPAYVDMAWSEVERALAEALSRKSGEPVEQMHRSELIPLTRALYGLASSLPDLKQIETQLGAVRYHAGATEATYGRPPWRVLPAALQRALLSRASSQVLGETFSHAPETARPPQAA